MTLPARVPGGAARHVRRQEGRRATACCGSVLWPPSAWCSCCRPPSAAGGWACCSPSTLPVALVGGVRGRPGRRGNGHDRVGRRAAHRARHRRPQRHRPHPPLPATGAARGSGLRAGPCPEGSPGATDPDADDRAGHRGRLPAGARARRPGGLRGPAPHGDRDPRWPRDGHARQRVRHAGHLPQLRKRQDGHRDRPDALRGGAAPFPTSRPRSRPTTLRHHWPEPVPGSSPRRGGRAPCAPSSPQASDSGSSSSPWPPP